MWRFSIALLAVSCMSGEPVKITINLAPLGQPGHREMFTEVNQVKLLPPSVLKEVRGGIAEPGGAFNATDVIMQGDPKPGRRLKIAGVSEHYCLMHYERGGIAHVWVIALFKLTTDKATLVWISYTTPKANLAEVKTVVESGTLRDEGGHKYW